MSEEQTPEVEKDVDVEETETANDEIADEAESNGETGIGASEDAEA